MPGQGFHSEWVTIKGHRILLECRAGFPDETMHFIAHVAVEICENNSRHARVVHINYDDKSCTWNIKVATTNPGDRQLDELFDTVFHTIFNNGNCFTEIIVVEPGDQSSDHFHYTEHLSVEAGIIESRFQ